MPIEQAFPTQVPTGLPGTGSLAMQTLWHYTSETNLAGILRTRKLNPSLKAHNPRDARYGDGQYLSDVRPGTKTSSQLASLFVRVPYARQRFTHYVEIDVAELKVECCREHVFLVPGREPLDLDGRIVSWGLNEWPGISG
ncbi:HYD1 signature containing ADP-ribosyltransferase family protein [Nonomuraea typhae]|uniref:HYD1 signature containing ADP-ribosyltransferase family protein n=1 Tax=Nonomuraea typhae TaxID=2603600 RepID=A0ABW7Z4E4_9ACTN